MVRSLTLAQSGWNFGLAGRLRRLLIAFVVIAGMYLAMMTGMAELSSTVSAAGGRYTSPGARSGRGSRLDRGNDRQITSGRPGSSPRSSRSSMPPPGSCSRCPAPGYRPRRLSVTNRRQAPTPALIVPGVIGFALSLTGQGAMLLNMAVFGAAVSYVLMMISHIVLRVREPGMTRPYRTPGGVVTTGFALFIAVFAVIATFLVDSVAALCCLGVFAAFLAYFGLYSRKHLVANSPDEEFAALAAAEDELKAT